MKPDHARFLNVIDVEATCWEFDAPEGQVSEIIEIGLCVVDVETRERTARDRILVRPGTSRVSDFCHRLTGLSQEEVDGGVDFRTACATLAERHRGASRRWASWGDYDRKQFQRQCSGADVPYPFAPRHINAKAVFSEAHGLKSRPGMARALRRVGLPLEGRHHNGADDAWNIGALVLHLIDHGSWPGRRT
ncbi:MULTISPECIES: 3'-5' exonuclease [unclassified Streptomyces]|uniref:3'-5' exonuclease n=1 Tax=unclassified Streptomyces TaxID=2593676 RepID=UPI002DDA8CAC|nr:MULTISPECIES: 3'-5' exonuclease [unclassified Streptomyces]WSB75660.1 exonuclease domain-containing protein [Streptomyces sp. NBC_01775]WSS16055.1 exonuclease domain-containing protein [Streptomyces sp. NBC_01186]WSS44874.1 exonuclease domain-containing protein [Streptomyces sp. NBC_01187]